MKTINVVGNNGYPIYIGTNILENVSELIKHSVKGKKCLIVTDSNVAPLYLDKVKTELSNNGFTVDSFIFPAGEESKNLTTIENILNAMCKAKLTRSDFAVALGGGVCGDMTGFAAAIYLRGIEYVGIPTTLLSQIDSSVGGKTGCDLSYGKNLAGAFHSPKCVIIDRCCLSTLSDEIYSDGLGEAIKYGMINSKSLFDRLLSEDAHDFEEDLVYECVMAKKKVTENDYFDTGERMLLNFGHTLGHAIEKYYNFQKYTHGQAVAIGMVMITKIAEEKGICKKGVTDLLLKCVKKYNLPDSCPADIKDILSAVFNDKKRMADSINLVLPKDIGECFIQKTDVEDLEKFFVGD